MQYLVVFLFLPFVVVSANSLKTPPKAPKAIVFDYGGVVAKINRKAVLQFLSKNLHMPYAKIQTDFSASRLYEALNQPPSFWQAYSPQPLSANWFVELEALKKELSQGSPEMRWLILKIKENPIKVALLSNTNKYRAEFLRSSGGYDLFDPVLLSCDLHLRKPDPKIYQTLLQILDCKAEECVFIDNHFLNVWAARRAGIHGILFTSFEALKKELIKCHVILEASAESPNERYLDL